MRNLLLVFALCVCASAEVHRSLAAIRAFRKDHPCPVTGKTLGPCPGYVIDHRWPLCAGGKDAPENMQWQDKKASLVKDKEEWRICRELKSWNGVH